MHKDTEKKADNSSYHVTIFTDGACQGNPGPGGWAAIMQYQAHEKILQGNEKHTTNNRMELTAAIAALTHLKKKCVVDLYTDSQYVKRGITEWISKWKNHGWVNSARDPVKNADLWKELDALVLKHEVHWHWVKAHNGHLLNERVDQLARAAIEQ